MREEKALHFLCRDCCNDIPKLTPEDDEVISSVSIFLLLLEKKTNFQYTNFLRK